MKTVNLTETLKTIRGEPVFEQDGKTTATLRYILCSALIAPIDGSGDEKFIRGALAIRLRDAGDVELLTEAEVKLLRTCVGSAYPHPEIVHGVWQLLDAPEVSAGP
jgi:hypothetical protein